MTITTRGTTFDVSNVVAAAVPLEEEPYIRPITLEGTADDWRTLGQRVTELGRFGVAWWIEQLEEVCAQFIAASEGDVDRGFWESIYKWQGPRGSGSPYVK